ncbi:MAG: hypothetical protein CVU56_18330 [Deltaproteobacteria bacterium HGW-Deltaproteobacteria-14]|nr:MAG: hypothetical protein CVU56_18330 [Deltaproteobacteria bacterium HGW-Deltaproteobacteria-14]
MNAAAIAPEVDVDAIIAEHSRSFSMASRLFPREHRRDARVVYAWCRRADDLVDTGPPEAGPARLAALREELDAIYAGAPLTDPVLVAFAEVVGRRAIPRAYPDALLDGMAMDVAGTHYARLSDLLRYCYRVASAVGLMMCHVMGVRRDEALIPAARLGLAMQLSNISRDVLEDWERGRLYLPADMLAAAGAPPLIPAPGEPWPDAATPAVATVIRQLLDLADAFYVDADTGLRDLSGRSRLAVHAARLIYARIGHVVRRRGCDPTRGRAWVSTPRKLWLALRAAASTLLSLFAVRGPVRPPTLELVLTPELLVPSRAAVTSLVSAPAPAPRRVGLAALLVMAVAMTCATPPAGAEPTRPAPAAADAPGTVVVALRGFDNDDGQALVALFTSKRGFPGEERRAHARAPVKIVAKRAQVVFEHVPPGEFAVSAFHDEDGDNALDTGLFGAPTEDYGASRDARNTFGPPDWEDARLTLAPGERMTVPIRIH